jgi:hypothetical protein
MIVRLNNGFFSNPPMQGNFNRNQMMNGNMQNSAAAFNVNGNNLAQFGMPINPAQKNLFINNNPQFNQMNNVAAAPVNNQIHRSYNFKQMDHGSNSAMSNNLRGSLNNNNISNNSVKGSNSIGDASLGTNSSITPATAQVLFRFYLKICFNTNYKFNKSFHFFVLYLICKG